MNKKSTQVIIWIVIAVVAFGAGWGIKGSSSSSSTGSMASGYSGSFSGAGTHGFGGAGRGGAGGGLVAGTVVAVDPTSISVQLPNSTSTTATTGSTVVLYSTGTNILKSVIGSAADLSVGESVTVQGTANADGSMSASTIQIRPTQPSQTTGQ